MIPLSPAIVIVCRSVCSNSAAGLIDVLTFSQFNSLVNTYLDKKSTSLFTIHSMPRVPTAAKPERYSAERLPMLQAVKRGKAKAAGPFSDLTWVQQKAAEQWYWKFCLKWGNDLPPWRRGILIGVARRLAVNPPKPRFGYSLHACQPARALARQCRAAGIEHPRIVAMRRGLRWKQAGRPVLAACLLPV